MSVKLRFVDHSRTALCEADISSDWLAPLPALNEIVTLPDGQRVRVRGREMAYGMTLTAGADVTVIYDCERERKRPTKKPVR